MLIPNIGIHMCVLEIFMKCPLCARPWFLISIFIRNLSFVCVSVIFFQFYRTHYLDLYASRRKSLTTFQVSCLLCQESFLFFFLRERTEEKRAKGSSPSFLQCPSFSPERKFQPHKWLSWCHIIPSSFSSCLRRCGFGGKRP